MVRLAGRVAERDASRTDISRIVDQISTLDLSRFPSAGYKPETCKDFDHMDFPPYRLNRVLCRSINIETLAVFL